MAASGSAAISAPLGERREEAKPEKKVSSFETVYRKELFKFDIDASSHKNYRHLKVEKHNNTMQALRKELSHIRNTDWQYEPIEKLIGEFHQ